MQLQRATPRPLARLSRTKRAGHQEDFQRSIAAQLLAKGPLTIISLYSVVRIVSRRTICSLSGFCADSLPADATFSTLCSAGSVAYDPCALVCPGVVFARDQLRVSLLSMLRGGWNWERGHEKVARRQDVRAVGCGLRVRSLQCYAGLPLVRRKALPVWVLQPRVRIEDNYLSTYRGRQMAFGQIRYLAIALYTIMCYSILVYTF